MAKIKKNAGSTDWLDFLGSSGLPDEEMHFQTGNNFGLDSFAMDGTENEGPEDGGRLETTRGMAALPDGTIPVDREAEFSFVDLTDDSMDGLGMNFTDMLSEDEGSLPRNASVIDLEWLDPTQTPDLNRLPNNEKTLNAIPQLEEAWGHGKETNGIEFVENRDKDALQYHASLNDPNQYQKTAEEVAFAVRRALRRAHYGESIKVIQEELVADLGHEALRAKAAMQIIKDEHGLIGRVFVRASAFPGILKGKWVDKIKTKMAGARYVITDDPTIATKLGMRQVSEVPWAKALAYYAPRLTAAGYKVASDGNPKEALRRAFRVGPVAAPVQANHQPIDKPVVASAAEAEAAMAAPRPVAPVVLTAEDHAIAAKRHAALVQMARWVKEGKLSQKDAFRINASGADAGDMLRTATVIMTATQGVAVYDGLGAQLPKDAAMIRRQAFASLKEKTAALEAGMMKKAQSQLTAAVRAGLLTVNEAKRIAQMSKNAAELQTHTAAAVQAVNQRKTQMEAVKAADYKGTIQKAAVQLKTGDAVHLDPYMQRVMKSATEHGVKAGEILGYLKWARQQMAEGTMGRDLTQLVKARFAPDLRKAGRELFKEVRATHEGLSGHLYVDAQAYASKTGTTGCEEGAAKHRANSIKYVLAMARCEGCVFANANGACQQYNKHLADAPPVDDPKAYQAEALRLANADESEVTASMFNPNEFNLRNEPLEDVQIAGHHTAKQLGEVLFGGMEVE